MIELPVLDEAADQESAPRARFWRSVADLRNTDEFKELAREEFLPGASDAPSGASRRQFLQIMGASMALAGLSACRKPVETIVPFVRRPEDVLPGIPVEYASAMMLDGNLRPVLVESTDGRPTKIEGNADHPDSGGSTSIFEQASLLGLYDPDRSEFVLNGGEQSTWNDFKSFATGLPSGSSLAVIAPSSSSPTMAGLRARLGERFGSVRWVTHDARGNRVARGMQAAYGAGYRPRYRFSNADVIVSLGADFLGPNDPNTIGNTREFSESRQIDDASDSMSRLYVVESNYTTTGGMADNRLRLKASDTSVFATALAARLGLTNDSTPLDDHPWVAALASDLQSAGANGVVLAGDHLPAEIHEICAAINSSLGAVGTTVELLDASDDTADQSAELISLAAELTAGEYDTLLILGGNPVYDAPAGLDMAAAIDAVENSIHVGLYVDETASEATWHVPATHYLEHWSDGRSHSGHLSVVQPLIAPLYEAAHSDLEVLALLAEGREQYGYDLVRATWREQLAASAAGESFDRAWRRVLHDGLLPDSGYATATPSFAGSVSAAAATSLSTDEFEVVVSLDPTVHDGQFVNNAWLQELPAPTTKIVWDNVAVMSPATAEGLGVRNRLSKGAYYVDHVRIDVEGRSIEIPAWIQPGVADGSIQLTAGYGRSIASTRAHRETNLFDLDDYTDIYGTGAVANELGVNVHPVRSGGEFVVSGAAVTRVEAETLIASTQDHGAIEEEANVVAKRGLFRQATVDEYRADPNFVKDEEPAPIREDWSDYPTLWQENHPTDEDAYKDNPYNQNQWGMVIDLNTCTGCNACVVACQAENNIQVVGKDEVRRGREMHWIRLDRYFVTGDGASFDDPQMVLQPVPCMHCENAPCEQVCPVAATIHSPDGTNQMIYNRCIGTRYCANNCPYKVRRFNYFNWVKTLPDSVRMAQNPNVTVRSRGVMEKCSYCVQRIRTADRQANVEDRRIRDGEVQTACQQACPANAITFGDLANPESEVSRKRENPRNYTMLAELLVKPRTSYLGRIRNPNPNLSSGA